MNKIKKFFILLIPATSCATIVPFLTSCGNNKGSSLSATILTEFFVNETITRNDFNIVVTKKDGSKQTVTDWTCETVLPYTFVDTQPHEFVIHWQNLTCKVTKKAQEHMKQIKVTFTTDGNGTLDGSSEITIQGPVAWSAITKPIAKANATYRFDKWVDENNNEIESTRIFKDDFTAKATFKAVPQSEYGLKFLKQSLAGDTFIRVSWDNTDAISENVVIPSSFYWEKDQTSYPVRWVQSFANCSKIKTIKIPSTVTLIDNDAFKYDSTEGTSQLTNITFDENSSLESIGQNAFYGCGNLVAIEIPKSVTKIDTNAFDMSSIENPKLSNVTFQENSILEAIGKDAFKNCKEIKSIVLPNSLKTLGGLNGTSIVTIDIPQNVTEILDNCFYSNDETTQGLLETINFDPNSKLNKIGDSAFKNTKISTISIPDTVTNIGGYAFQNCQNLSVVNFTDNSTLKQIGTYGGKVFDNCPSLTSFTIPDSVTSIGYQIFGISTSSKITSLTFKDLTHFWKLGSVGSLSFKPTSDTSKNATEFLKSNDEYAFSKIV